MWQLSLPAAENRALEPRGLDGRVESSLLGRNARIGRDNRQPHAYRFMLGDNSEVRVP